MEHRDVAARRRMVRRFAPDSISEEVVDRVVAAIRSGPSAGYAQGISVISVTDADRRRGIAEQAGEPAYVERGFEPWLSVAPVHLVLCVEPQRYRDRYAEEDKDPAALGIPWWWVDGGAAMVLGALAAVDEGLAAGFMGGHAFDDLHALLGIPSGVEVLGVLTIGHGLDDRASSSLERGRRSDGSYRERWGNQAPKQSGSR